MTRFARERRVFFVEEPVGGDRTESYLKVFTCPQSGVQVVTPHLAADVDTNRVLRQLLAEFVKARKIEKPVVWYYTPMALEFFPEEVVADAVIYDCMDELSAFRGAPTRLQQLEEKLLKMADLVFTGGVSLFESKRHFHPRVHPFPSGVDIFHFLKARSHSGDYRELADIPRPRIGYAGVIDERLDLALIDEVARRRPEWHLIMIGPTAKLAPEALPRRDNIHYLGMKDYADLPRYFAGWDVGMMPFAMNEATRFISPTKTPEYLSAGLPVVSTPIHDVVRSYGQLGMARIAATPDEFIAASEQAMAGGMCLKWRERADEYLRGLSWDSVWGGMNELIDGLSAPVKRIPATPAKTMTAFSKQEVSASV